MTREDFVSLDRWHGNTLYDIFQDLYQTEIIEIRETTFDPVLTPVSECSESSGNSSPISIEVAGAAGADSPITPKRHSPASRSTPPEHLSSAAPLDTKSTSPEHLSSAEPPDTKSTPPEHLSSAEPPDTKSTLPEHLSSAAPPDTKSTLSSAAPPVTKHR